MKPFYLLFVSLSSTHPIHIIFFRRYQGQIPKQPLLNGGNLELHHILSQRASLVTKHILNLPQLLIKRRTFHSDRLFSPLTVHELVAIDEVFLKQLNDLNRND